LRGCHTLNLVYSFYLNAIAVLAAAP
jgi:hypothetical protein